MKRFEFKVILHIIVIFLLSISSCLLYQRQLWFSTTSLPNTVQTNRLITAINGWTPIQRYNAESSSSF